MVAILCHQGARKWDLRKHPREVPCAWAVLGEGCSGVPWSARVRGASYLETNPSSQRCEALGSGVVSDSMQDSSVRRRKLER